MTDLSQRTKDRWEIPLASLHFKERLGSGQFGEVWRALFTGSAVVPGTAVATAGAASVGSLPGPSSGAGAAAAGGEHEGSPTSSDGGAPGSSTSSSSRQVAVEVAVKRLRTDAYQTPSYVEDFMKEAAIMKRLSHPNLVRIFDKIDYTCTQFNTLQYYIIKCNFLIIVFIFNNKIEHMVKTFLALGEYGIINLYA